MGAIHAESFKMNNCLSARVCSASFPVFAVTLTSEGSQPEPRPQFASVEHELHPYAHLGPSDAQSGHHRFGVMSVKVLSHIVDQLT